MLNFGRGFFSPSGRPQELQHPRYQQLPQSSSTTTRGFQTNTLVSSSTTGANIHTIPSQEAQQYHIEDPIHIKFANWFRYFPLCSNIIFCVCVILFIVQGVFNEPKSSDICYSYSASMKQAKVWQLFTFPFFHGSIMHILFNMLALYQFGNRIESTLGTIYFFFISLLMLILASAIWVAIDALFIDAFKAGQVLGFLLDRCTVGYSGVLFAYLVFTVQYKPLFESLYPGAHYADFAPKLIPWLMLIVTSFLMPNVSLMGHLTGMLGGYAVWLMVRFISPLNKFFLFVDSKVPRFIRNRSFFFVSDETVFREASTPSTTTVNTSETTSSPPSNTSQGGFFSNISQTVGGWFGRGNQTSTDSNSSHSWGRGRALGSN
ncbi:hypothetical protein C9374_014430 [Naegleria lovaniensis]|uniref:Peptidase S54 rhomboid domain-containing protein n=1 Tax=Naegleria lovaniensis TaxID=51637 RepID=A0AA88GUC8_NAELO|nr:uncharacterized protein C9374_014430 [Naegleria lovaniensis]KAG2389030.1 hypothetical protein C9374_014430 [Naegleria lovaniensis]